MKNEYWKKGDFINAKCIANNVLSGIQSYITLGVLDLAALKSRFFSILEVPQLAHNVDLTLDGRCFEVLGQSQQVRAIHCKDVKLGKSEILGKIWGNLFFHHTEQEVIFHTF